MFRTVISLLAFLMLYSGMAQRPAEQPTSSEIIHRLQSLNTLGSVLYIAAHPDDENTRLISYLANGAHMRTGYLSLTRGSGGQNLIGTELSDGLGIIRTQELLEARRIDGGEQFFTRAVDYGYSKTADEAYEKWGKEEILNDVVRVIRQFKPDVIVMRFPPSTRGGHGHHQASAFIALEAFDKAGNPEVFPEHMEQGLSPWRTKRIFWNGSTWWDKDLAEKAETEPDWVSVDVGAYDPLLGLSYTELAGRSRSMHKSQGFGAAQTKGSLTEYLHLEKGAGIERNDIFEGVDITWNRVLGGSGVGDLITQLIRTFDPKRPERIADAFELLHNEMSALPPGHWKDVKLQELEKLMIDITATSIEALMDDHIIPVGTDHDLEFELLTRANFPVDVIGVMLPGDTSFREVGPTLLTNDMTTIAEPFKAPDVIDQPLWLKNDHENLFVMDDPTDIGKAVDDNLLTAHVKLRIANIEIIRKVPVLHKWVDRVDGERIRPAVVTPIASITPDKEIAMVNGKSVTIDLEVESFIEGLSGTIKVSAPKGWRMNEDLKMVEGLAKGDRISFSYTLTRSEDAEPGHVSFKMKTDRGGVKRSMRTIDHSHLLPQTYFTEAHTRLVPLDVNVTVSKVGYVPGAGDRIPEALQTLGIAVETINSSTATLEEIKEYDAIVTGIRAYNKDPEMVHFNKVLLEYVEQGGNLVVQYNTSRGLMEDIGPHPFDVTRHRVTLEDAEPTILDPDHELMTSPNRITESDFEGWVQERGLYFTDNANSTYTRLIAWNDPGDESRDGALIACKHGKGRFIYTGISFFRQLPAGVPGAYRLFANLISKPNTE